MKKKKKSQAYRKLFSFCVAPFMELNVRTHSYLIGTIFYHNASDENFRAFSQYVVREEVK